MRREERPRILVDGTSRYNRVTANCEDVTVKPGSTPKTHIHRMSDRHE